MHTVKLPRYRTDYRLWMWIALALFVVSWFLPSELKGDSTTRIGHLQWLYDYYSAGNTTFDNLMEQACVETILSTLASIIFAWVIQCFIVIARPKRPEVTHDEG